MSDISYSVAVFQQSHQDEIVELVKKFNGLRAKVIPNTAVQLTNFQLIQKLIDVGKFIDNDDITPTSFQLIEETIKEVESFLSSDEFKQAVAVFRKAASLQSIKL